MIRELEQVLGAACAWLVVTQDICDTSGALDPGYCVEGPDAIWKQVRHLRGVVTAVQGAVTGQAPPPAILGRFLKLTTEQMGEHTAALRNVILATLQIDDPAFDA